MARIAGELQPLPGADPLKGPDTEQALAEILTQPTRLEELSAEGEVDFAFAVPGWPASASTLSASGARSRSSAGASPTA